MLFSAKRLVLFVLCLGLLLGLGSIQPEYLAWREIMMDKVKVTLPPQYLIPISKKILNPAASPSAQLIGFDAGALVSAKSYAVIDYDTGTVMLEKNYRHPLPPASTIKMMTALVARGYLDPNAFLSVVASDSADESRPVFKTGDTFSLYDWLKALLVPSSNTAARVLSRNVELDGTNYLDAVTQHAQMFGLTDSKFFNASGIDAYGQVMSARDEYLLARKLLTDAQMAQIVSLADIEIIATPSGQKYNFTNTNELLKTDPSVRGVKTGTTPQAGEVLVSLFDKPPHKYLVIVMGSSDRFSDTLNLLFKAQNSHDYSEIKW